MAKSQMQVSVHPDVSRLVHRFGRIHHYVDYGPFKNNELVRKKGVTISSKVDNYGMGLIESSNFKDSGETFSPDIGNGT